MQVLPLSYKMDTDIYFHFKIPCRILSEHFTISAIFKFNSPIDTLY